MKTPEVLAPVGDWSMLRAAVHNGADAVYIGMPGFNARGRAATLDIPELRAMIEYAHLYGVRVLLACNILLFERELSAVLKLLSEVIPLHPDALIVQDIGLVRLIKSLAPDQVVHASTQMTVTDSAAILLTQDLGIRRYVLGREVSLSEMALIRSKIAHLPSVELEVFVHGALCVSYSGQCLTSETLGGRSANRGQCAQSCRLPYSLFVDGKEVELGDRHYLVSPKDLCSLDEIPELCRIEIDSFKIEGRLKSPQYVASTVRAYKARVAESLQNHVRSGPSRSDLEKVYSRGFFSGWMHGVDHQRLVDGRYGSHYGLEVGTVQNISGHYVDVESSEPLGAGDGVLFLQESRGTRCGGAIFEATSISERGNTTVWRLAFSRDFDLSKISVGSAVFVNSAPALDHILETSFTDKAQLKRIPISISASGAIGTPLTIRVTDDSGNTVEVNTDAVLQLAQRAPLTIDAVRDELSSLGGSIYRAVTVECAIPENVFLHNRELKVARRLFCAKLTDVRIGRSELLLRVAHAHTLLRSTDNVRRTSASALPPPSLSVLLRESSQLDALTDFPIDTVYLDFEFGKEYSATADRVRALGKKVGIATTRILKPGEQGHLKVIERIRPDVVLVRNLGALHYFQDSGLKLIGDFSLNITNSLSAEWCITKGLSALTPSADLNKDQLLELLQASPPTTWEVPVHYYMPAFHMEHCVFAAFLSSGSSYRDCGRPCEKYRVEIKDPSGRVHPLKADAECRNTMFNGEPQSALRMFSDLQSHGVHHFRLEALFENPTQLRRKVEVYLSILSGKVSVDAGINSLETEHLAATDKIGVTDGQLYNIKSYQDRKKSMVRLSEISVSADPALNEVLHRTNRR